MDNQARIMANLRVYWRLLRGTPSLGVHVMQIGQVIISISC